MTGEQGPPCPECYSDRTERHADGVECRGCGYVWVPEGEETLEVPLKDFCFWQAQMAHASTRAHNDDEYNGDTVHRAHEQMRDVLREYHADEPTGPNRDWHVQCQCGAEYTPKSRTEPTECFRCGSYRIVAFPLCQDCGNMVKYKPENGPRGSRCAPCCLRMMERGEP